MTREARHFVYKLIPPRPTFDVDATDDEQAIMALHIAYLAEREDELRDIAADDPAVKSGLCTYEVGTMPTAVVAA
jgi:hypothetical protein